MNKKSKGYEYSRMMHTHIDDLNNAASNLVDRLVLNNYEIVPNKTEQKEIFGIISSAKMKLNRCNLRLSKKRHMMLSKRLGRI